MVNDRADADRFEKAHGVKAVVSMMQYQIRCSKLN